MATDSLMGQARQQVDAGNTGAAFTPKDPREFIPPEQHDAVERVFAAGMKLMYSPEMADERQAALQSQDPVPKRLADNITGLMLTLDQRAKGGMPIAAIFPAAVLLVNEAANMLVHGGVNVTQDDYNHSLQILYVQLGKKLNMSDDQLMQGAQDALAKTQGGMAPEDQTAATGAPVAPDPTAAGPMNAGQAPLGVPPAAPTPPGVPQ
jgi:hypothetical protein